MSFELIAENDNQFEYPLKTWTVVKNRNEYDSKIENLFVNKKEATMKYIGEHEDDDSSICDEQNIILKGATKYAIQYTQIKTYNINEDYYIGFRARYIVNNLRVSLDYPENVEAIFTCRGTQNDFENVKNTNRRIEKRYKGIILPRQGYIFVLRKTN